MSILSQVTKGKIRQPILTLIYGVDGIGKSTFGANAPKPIFLGTENGTGNLDVARFPTPGTFNDVLKCIDALAKEQHDYKTLVIDSLDWLEPLVWEQVVYDANEPNKIKTIEDFGFGKGFVIANTYWRRMIAALSEIRREKGMNIVLIAHSVTKEAKDPTVTLDYNRYQLKLNDKAGAIWREFVDSVVFANYETFVSKDSKSGKTKAMGDGARYIFTERRPAFDAKNRHGLPYQLPLDWQAFVDAHDLGQPEDPQAMITSIQELLVNIQKQETKEAIIASVKDAAQASDVAKLSRILNKVRTLAGAA